MSNEDWSMGFTYTKMPSSFYRVTAKALIVNGAGNLLLTKNDNGQWEVPGGGWEYDEDLEQCVRREVREELGVEALTIGTPSFAVNPVNLSDVMTVRIAAPVELTSLNFAPSDGMATPTFIDEIDEPITMELSDAEVVARFYGATTLHHD